jgi:hypothetical protein
MSARTIVASAALALVAVGGVAAPAEATLPAQPRCASKAEYSKIERGMTVQRVVHIIGSHGKITFEYVDEFTNWQDREWKRCGMARYHGVSVSFTDGVVSGKGKW